VKEELKLQFVSYSNLYVIHYKPEVSNSKQDFSKPSPKQSFMEAPDSK